jgi:hypothetical protein
MAPGTARPSLFSRLGRAAANDGRACRVHLVVGAARGESHAGLDALAAELGSSLALAGPAIRFEVAVAPLRGGAAADDTGVGDFRVLAAVGVGAPQAGDVIAVPSRLEAGSLALRLRPAGVPFAGLLAPPLQGLCSLGARFEPADQALVALAFAAHALTAAGEPSLSKDATAAALVERLAATLRPELDRPDTDAVRTVEIRLLLAWARAWRALAGDAERELDDARRTIDDLINDPDIDVTRREAAQLHAIAALICLALDGGGEGSRRLSEGLGYARAASAHVDRTVEPGLATDLRGLIGELAGTLALRHRDRDLLAQARAGLAESLASVRHSPAHAERARLLVLVERALAELR